MCVRGAWEGAAMGGGAEAGRQRDLCGHVDGGAQTLGRGRWGADAGAQTAGRCGPCEWAAGLGGLL